ncbi:MAG: glycosyltransferase family 39 protein [Chloroflexi bacterium]|uniref:Glycosyltransferase family 39 protein n=1 Tax=Candidatus Chlorohelix allophototropha TaxID=3003348 RepID=A0A8T7M6N7_9CHLR|nr:glycosyltransferase family 39 protein [Chloroflexota bacterium]WJW69680.1 glycosyltransferase family 39 protein [Chloroflexota bacterium L227-S17]
MEVRQKLANASVSNNAVMEQPQGLIARWWHRLMADPVFAYCWHIYLTHRLLLFALGAALVILAPVEPPMGASLLRDLDPNFWGPGFFFLQPWQRWDTNWYIHIARFGYDIGNGTTNFPPLYPLLIAILGKLLVGQHMLAALLVSNIAYLAAMFYLYRLSALIFDDEIARGTLVWLAVFPGAFFLLGGYTESLYLALACAAFYYGEKDRWVLAAVLAGLAGITRIQGFILILPLGYLYLQQRDWKWRKLDRNVLALALAPSLLALYFFYVYFMLGDHNFGNHLSIIWSVRFAPPWESFFGGLIAMFNPSNVSNLIYNVLDLVTLVIFICFSIVWWQRKLPRQYLIYIGTSLLVYLTRAGTGEFIWMSMTRYLVVLFPCFMLMAKSAPHRFIKFSAALQAIWATLFIFWMWAG